MKPIEQSPNALAILAELRDGKSHTVSEIAKHLTLNVTTVRRVLQRQFLFALVEERKELKGGYIYRITRNGLKELATASGDLPNVPKPGDLVPYLKAMSESLAQMADRLSAYEL